MRNVCWLISALTILSCHDVDESFQETPLSTGIWRGALNIGVEEIPFLFEVSEMGDESQITFINGAEKISAIVNSIRGDSIEITMPVFNSKFSLKKIGKDSLIGIWQNFNKRTEYIIPFSAKLGNKNRFKVPDNPIMGSLDHKWRVTFSPNTSDQTPAIGLFDVDEKGIAHGSFATETGDYRFLDGLFCDSLLRLSCFDGAHAFLFKARQLPSGKLEGDFWSGHSWHEQWVATIDNRAKLTHPDSLSKTIIPDEEISFSFPGLGGDTIDLNDERFQDKVVMIQIFGSWCPNCADESIYYQKLYEKFNDKGLEIIGLAFEASRDQKKALKAVEKFRSNLNLEYDMAIAGYYSKKEATETLGFLDRVISFPTTLFIDRNGAVRKVHTGFYGPGTGVYYDEYMQETETFIESLL